MPKQVREPFGALWGELTRIHFRWKLWKQLYGTGQRRVDLLNEMAQGYFYQLQFLMLDDVVLSVARLMDPARSKGDENMTLRLLLERVEAPAVEPAGPKAAKSELETLLEIIDKLGKPLRKHRHKRIAHADYQHHAAVVGSVLPGISIAMINDVLKALAKFMNTVQTKYEDGITAYAAVDSLSDGDSLIRSLQKAADWKDLIKDPLERRDRIANSRYSDIEEYQGDWDVN